MTEEQVKRIIEILERQEMLLGAIVVALAPEEAAPSDECQHPEDKRVSLATPSMPHHWICSDCKHEHRGVIQN